MQQQHLRPTHCRLGLQVHMPQVFNVQLSTLRVIKWEAAHAWDERQQGRQAGMEHAHWPDLCLSANNHMHQEQAGPQALKAGHPRTQAHATDAKHTSSVVCIGQQLALPNQQDLAHLSSGKYETTRRKYKCSSFRKSLEVNRTWARASGPQYAPAQGGDGQLCRAYYHLGMCNAPLAGSGP